MWQRKPCVKCIKKLVLSLNKQNIHRFVRWIFFIERNRALRLKGHCFVVLPDHRPLKATGSGSKDRQYPDPEAAIAGNSWECCFDRCSFVWTLVLAARWDRVERRSPKFPVGVAHRAAAVDRGCCVACASRRIGEYSDCTSNHLPSRNNEPELLKKEVAIFASFAARIARSSLAILSLLK